MLFRNLSRAEGVATCEKKKNSASIEGVATSYLLVQEVCGRVERKYLVGGF